MNARHAPRVIAVSSGKGGVGKTFLSVHLAARAAAQGKRVLLLDADLGLANVDVMLGISARGSIQQVVEAGATLEEIMVRAPQGFDVLPGGSGLYELSALSSAQQMLMLDEMDAIAGNYDLVLIDTAAGIGENVLYFVSAAEAALVVMTPDPTSLTDAYALIKVLSRQRDVRRFMVAVNQADEIEAQLAYRRLLMVADRYLSVQLDYVGHMPSTLDVRRAVQSQTLIDQMPSATCRQSLYKLLDTILQQPRDGARGSGLQFFWQHSLAAGLGNGHAARSHS